MGERMTKRVAVTALKPGDRVVIRRGHPHEGRTGTLVAFEPYGPRVLGFVGWRVALDGDVACYAKPADLDRVEGRR